MDLSKIRTLLILLSLCIVLGGFAGLIIAIGGVDAGEPAGKSLALNDTQLVRYGLLAIMGGSALSLLFVLWKAKTLHREWIGALAFGFKAIGLLLVLLFAFWTVSVWQKRQFAEQRAQNERAVEKAQEDKKEADSKNQQAAKAQRYRDNSDRALRIVRELYNAGSADARRDLVAVEATNLLDDDLVSLPLAQAIYNVAAHDQVDSVREFALRQLFPDATTKPAIDNFVTAVLAHVADWCQIHKSGIPPEVYIRYLALILENVEEQGTKSAAQKYYDDFAKRKLNIASTTEATPGVEQTAQVLVALTSSDLRTRAAATKKLEELTPSATPGAPQQPGQDDTIQRAIQSLPAAITRRLPPRIYVRVATKGDISKAARKLEQLKADGFIVRTPTVMSDAPKVTIVRYYAPDREADAARIRDVIAGGTDGVREVRTDYRRPSTGETKISVDIASHFEVFFASGAF